ncbi:MAG: Type 1 glutamine amidotransferase-like domain-containing protein [Acidimicrobiales bacterium]
MTGPIGLVGSGEFLACSDVIDGALLDRVSGRAARAVIIPTAAGQEGPTSVGSWLDKGIAHFDRLGLEPVPLSIIDRVGADDPANAEQIGDASIIYFSGGNPAYVIETMRNTLVWAAVLAAWRDGAALAGCSAGAMMMGSVTASPRQAGLVTGLGVFADLCVIPHFDRFDSFRPGMTDSILGSVAPGTTVIGVDEETGLVVHDGESFVMGRRAVWSLTSEGRTGWHHGDSTTLRLSIADTD